MTTPRTDPKQLGLGVLGVLLLAHSAACSPRAKPIEDVPDLLPSTAPQPDASPPPETTEGDADSSDQAADTKTQAQIDQAARALERCKPAADAQFEDCTAFATWTNGEQAWFEGTDRDSLLVELLSSKQPAVRFAAAGTLVNFCSRYSADTKLAASILSAAEAEQDALVGPRMAQLVIKLDYLQVGMTKRATNMLADHPNRALRLALITDGSLLPGGSQLVAERFADPDPEVKRAVVEGLWMGEETLACGVFAKAFKQKDFLAADKAAYGVALGSRCNELIGATLLWASRVRTVPEGATIAATLGAICERKEAKPVERLQAGMHAKRFTGKAPQSVRLDALRSVMRCDPKAGVYFVQRFSKDADPKVAELAQALVAKAKAVAAKPATKTLELSDADAPPGPKSPAPSAAPKPSAKPKPGPKPKSQISITPAE